MSIPCLSAEHIGAAVHRHRIAVIVCPTAQQYAVVVRVQKVCNQSCTNSVAERKCYVAAIARAVAKSYQIGRQDLERSCRPYWKHFVEDLPTW